MGNSSRRSSFTRSFFERSSMAESSFKRSPILESQLAPQKLSSANDRDAECPICFLSYETFNTTSCCKQHICTECYFQVKQNTTTACPFCGVASFVVRYVASATDQTTTPSTKSEEEAKEPIVNTPAPVAAAGIKASPSSSATSYLTPEQDRKLRSTSFDSTHTNSNSASLTASKRDRDELEQQIRSQRSHLNTYDDDFMSPYRSSSGYSSSSTRSNSSGGVYYRSPPNANTNNNSNSNEYNTWFVRRREQQAQAQQQAHAQPPVRRRIAGSYNPQAAAASPPSPPPLPPRRLSAMNTTPVNNYGHREEEEDDDEQDEERNEGEALIASLQSLLNGHALQRVPSLEQLEELMLMEAIRQSMQDSGAASVPPAPADPPLEEFNYNSISAQVASPAPPPIAAPAPSAVVMGEEAKAEDDEDDLLQLQLRLLEMDMINDDAPLHSAQDDGNNHIHE